MEAKIGINPTHLAEIAHSLCQLLADEYILYTKTRNAHWNVEGMDFYSKHKFFEDQYTQLDAIIDEVAERIRKLGHYAPATLNQFLALTHLMEDHRGGNDAQNYIKILLADHESIAIHLRENIHSYESLKDVGTGDFITGLLEKHESMAWMLRAHLS